MKIIEYSVKNPLLVNLLMVGIFILGTIALIEMPRELNPKVSFNWVFVIVPYPGAGAVEIEKIITTKVEEAVDDVDDINMITGESSEGASFVMITFDDISDQTFRERLNEVESAVNRIDFPEGALDPEIMDFDSEDFLPVISVSILGDMPERELQKLSDALKDDLMDIKGVAQVSLSGTREREVWIEVQPQKLVQHNLSMTQIVQAIGSRNLNLPAGDIKIGRQSYLVRTVGEIESLDGLGKIVVRWDPRGNHLYLGQVANIKDTWARASTIARMDGQPAATLSIARKGSANSLEIIAKVKEAAERYRKQLPAGSSLVFTNDTGIWMKDLLGKLQTNALLGFVLVILILYVFMGFRNALVAAIGIPIAFWTTFYFMSKSGQTFNGSALFGLMLVLGVVVDDAIIVVENCFRHRHLGKSAAQAAIDGASEVFSPVISATLTTIAVFLPLMLMSGIMGKFMRVIPIVVSLTLVASLIEVFLIAPSHFTEWAGGHAKHTQRWFRRLRKIYTHILISLIRKRYLVGPSILILAVLLAMLIPLVGQDLYSGDEWSQFFVWVEMPSGTSLAETDRVIRAIEKFTEELKEGEVHTVIGNTGLMQVEADWIYADNVGQVIVDLVESEFRDREMDDIMEDLRGKVKNIEGPTSIRIKEVSQGPPVGKPVEIKVKGKYLEELAEVAEAVKAELRQMPGVFEINDDNQIGKTEIKVIIDEERAAMHGLSVAMVAGEVRSAIAGVQATIFRDGDEEVDVLVKLEGGDDLGYDGLRGLMIMAPTGAMVRLDNICRLEEAPTLFKIKRFEKERAITVSANINKSVTSAIKVNKEVMEKFEDISLRYPGYRLDFRGEFKEFEDAFKDLGKLFIVGIILVFVILGAQFKSIKQSLIILITVPFAFIGSMIGLLVTGNPFSLMTMYGMVALAGIAVNDAIVMVSFINNKRRNGSNKWTSIIEAGRIRLRPIILTSVTTILGLMPMAIGLGGKSETWGPLATTIVWGLAVATLLTLFAIPTVYSIAVDDSFGFRLIMDRIRRSKRSRKE
ncbi:MAG: efflux RND transporter permease subunit [Calditrichaeota bacterium]|jgi:multidrug efflux pump|nr:efflux RND transporter permease subunit [Calditrichota bacterium]MBT7789211.1 efflux RND transporter permease subunit [Calditrichota bacterium]